MKSLTNFLEIPLEDNESLFFPILQINNNTWLINDKYNYERIIESLRKYILHYTFLSEEEYRHYLNRRQRDFTRCDLSRLSSRDSISKFTEASVQRESIEDLEYKDMAFLKKMGVTRHTTTMVRTSHDSAMGIEKESCADFKQNSRTFSNLEANVQQNRLENCRLADQPEDEDFVNEEDFQSTKYKKILQMLNKQNYLKGEQAKMTNTVEDTNTPAPMLENMVSNMNITNRNLEDGFMSSYGYGNMNNVGFMHGDTTQSGKEIVENEKV